MLATEAAKILDVHQESFSKPKGRYYKYYTPSPKGTRGLAQFDIERFLKDEERNMDISAKGGLFVEYLVYEKNINYKQMGIKSGILRQSLGKHPMTTTTVEGVVKAYRDQLKDFNKFYNWRETILDTLGE